MPRKSGSCSSVARERSSQARWRRNASASRITSASIAADCRNDVAQIAGTRKDFNAGDGLDGSPGPQVEHCAFETVGFFLHNRRLAGHRGGRDLSQEIQSVAEEKRCHFPENRHFTAQACQGRVEVENLVTGDWARETGGERHRFRISGRSSHRSCAPSWALPLRRSR